MTTEEKAKAYDEAVERAKKWRNATNADKIPTYASRIIGEIFPELADSEDERIREALLGGFKNYRISFEKFGGVDVNSIIDWLEKQGRQKPIKWSEEDERICQETIDWFELKCFPFALENENPARKSITWLKSLKEKINL